MDNTTLISLLSGPILSTAISYILAESASRRAATILTVVVCVVVALLTTIIGDGLVLTDAVTVGDWIRLIVQNIATILGSAWLFHEKISKPLNIDRSLRESGPQAFK